MMRTAEQDLEISTIGEFRKINFGSDRCNHFRKERQAIKISMLPRTKRKLGSNSANCFFLISKYIKENKLEKKTIPLITIPNTAMNFIYFFPLLPISVKIVVCTSSAFTVRSTTLAPTSYLFSIPNEPGIKTEAASKVKSNLDTPPFSGSTALTGLNPFPA